MVPINPIAASILQSTQVQRQQSAETDRTARRRLVLQKDSTAVEDELDHQIENSEQARQIHEQQHIKDDRRRRGAHTGGKPHDDEADPSHLDVTA
jgi:hypothetical protein